MSCGVNKRVIAHMKMKKTRTSGRSTNSKNRERANSSRSENGNEVTDHIVTNKMQCQEEVKSMLMVLASQQKLSAHTE